MISMNCMPPRPRASMRLATFPAANARILNSDMWNRGSSTFVSTKTKTISRTTPPIIAPRTNGFVHPMALPPYGWSP